MGWVFRSDLGFGDFVLPGGCLKVMVVYVGVLEFVDLLDFSF